MWLVFTILVELWNGCVEDGIDWEIFKYRFKFLDSFIHLFTCFIDLLYLKL